MSEPGGVSRRQLLESLMACASPFSAALDSPRAKGEGVLENASIESRVRTRAGKVVSRRLVDKLSDEPPYRLFALPVCGYQRNELLRCFSSGHPSTKATCAQHLRWTGSGGLRFCASGRIPIRRSARSCTFAQSSLTSSIG